MPCNCDYMNPQGLEVEVSKLYCVRDELRQNMIIPESWWRGYHPEVYGQMPSVEKRDKIIQAICSHLSSLAPGEIGQLSLETQLWWRDHQRADQERERREAQEAILSTIREQALSKLTPKEKEALGL